MIGIDFKPDVGAVLGEKAVDFFHQRFVEQQPGVGRTVSMVDLLAAMYRAVAVQKLDRDNPRALREALERGDVDVVATDHCAFTSEQKNTLS